MCVRGGRGVGDVWGRGGGDGRDAAADIFHISICHRQLLELRE